MINQTPLPDIELVNLVKEKNDSNALTELTNRHSGIYVTIAQKYSGFSDKIQLEEIKEDKEYNMYKWIIAYDPNRNMKLGTYIGEMTKYLCLDLLTTTPEKVELTAINEPATSENCIEQTINEDSLDGMKERAAKVSDPRFWKIFKLRHFGEKTHTWREVAKIIDMTPQGALNIYNRHIYKVKDFIT